MSETLSEARVLDIVATFPPSIRAVPIAGENFAQDPTAAKTRLQSYAFSCGFLIVHYRGSVKGGHISYKCVHHGTTPRQHRKKEPITPSAVSSTEYKNSKGYDDKGKKLRQRQSLVRNIHSEYSPTDTIYTLNF